MTFNPLSALPSFLRFSQFAFVVSLPQSLYMLLQKVSHPFVFKRPGKIQRRFAVLWFQLDRDTLFNEKLNKRFKALATFTLPLTAATLIRGVQPTKNYCKALETDINIWYKYLINRHSRAEKKLQFASGCSFYLRMRIVRRNLAIHGYIIETSPHTRTLYHKFLNQLLWIIIRGVFVGKLRINHHSYCSHKMLATLIILVAYRTLVKHELRK